jgi:hypothetical protein
LVFGTATVAKDLGDYAYLQTDVCSTAITPADIVLGRTDGLLEHAALSSERRTVSALAAVGEDWIGSYGEVPDGGDA